MIWEYPYFWRHPYIASYYKPYLGSPIWTQTIRGWDFTAGMTRPWVVETEFRDPNGLPVAKFDRFQLSGYINNEKVSPFHQLKMQVITPISMRLVPPVTYSFSVIYGGYRFTILITGRGPSCGLVIVLPQHFLSYGFNQLALIPILHETPWQLQIAAPKKTVRKATSVQFSKLISRSFQS